MAQPTWAPQKKAGESHSAYVKRYYSAQRESAEETGDQKTVDKIYGKLGKKSLVGARKGDNSLNVDANTTDKAALAAIPALAAGGRVGAGAMGRAGAAGAGRAAAGGASKAVAGGARKALGSGVKTATRVAKPAAKVGTRKLPGNVNRLPNAAQKALPGSRTASLAKAGSRSPVKVPTGGASRAGSRPALSGARKGPKMLPAPGASGKKKKAKR